MEVRKKIGGSYIPLFICPSDLVNNPQGPFYQAPKPSWKATLRRNLKDKKADLHVATRFKSPKAFYLAEIVVALT